VGARTLEAKLTARLLAVVAPALVALGVASVALTWWALDAADTTVLRERAEAARAAMHSELLEPDPFDQAARETIGAMNEVGGSLLVTDPGSARTFESRRPVPGELVATRAGSCAGEEDAAGKRWRACAAQDDLVRVVAAIDVTPHVKVVRTVGEGVALGILLALAAAAIAARSSLGGALASVRALVEWSERVVDVGRAPPAPVADTLEIARLATAFDDVVRRLVDAIARARATSENIAHELRTPLTTIRAELEALESSATLGEAPVVARLRGDVDRLARVVDAILVLAAPPGPSRAGDCVVNLADVARDLASPETEVDAPDEALVIADPPLVELAITNLLENARKHTGREACAIRVARAGDVVRVAVIDDGPGLSDEARARMFERYWQASGAGGGTGLGLALVRAVARRHGGDADARANAAGTGLEVGITFGNVVGWHEGSRAAARG
jgi:signal transduction histidine kinase